VELWVWKAIEVRLQSDDSESKRPSFIAVELAGNSDGMVIL
jgi:hypothetical protein